MAEEWGGGDLVSDSVGGSGKKRRMGMVDSTRLRGCVLQPVVDWDIFSIYVNQADRVIQQ